MAAPAYTRVDLAVDGGSHSIEAHMVVSEAKKEGTRRAIERLLPRGVSIATAIGENTQGRGRITVWDPDDGFVDALDADRVILYKAPKVGLPGLLYCAEVKAGRGRRERVEKHCYLCTQDDLFLLSLTLPEKWFHERLLLQGILNLGNGSFLVERLYHYNNVSLHDACGTDAQGPEQLLTARLLNTVFTADLFQRYYPLQVKARTSRNGHRDAVRLRAPEMPGTTEAALSKALDDSQGRFYRVVDNRRPLTVSWLTDCMPEKRPSSPKQTLIDEETW